VYCLLVASQYKRFIELIRERGSSGSFENKYTVSLSTSIHFYDHTAHNYMRAICEDLQMNYAGYYSAEMDDLLEKPERERLFEFCKGFFEAAANRVSFAKAYMRLSEANFRYEGGFPQVNINVSGKNVLLLTDSENDGSNLGKMVKFCCKCFSDSVEVVNIRQMNIIEGCIGCLQCSYDNKCVFKDADDFVDFYNTKFQMADIIIFAGNIKDRYLSSRWKMFFDRSFFNNHTPKLVDKQVGFIVSGPLGEIANLREILEAYTELNGGNLVDFVTDECKNGPEINSLLQSMARRLVSSSQSNYIKPPTFYTVGGRTLLRDYVWGRIRFPFQADHKYYKEHDIYDFPHKNRLRIIRNKALFALTKIPWIRKEIYEKKIKKLMLRKLEKALKKSN
jgi:hypothetical protein